MSIRVKLRRILPRLPACDDGRWNRATGKTGFRNYVDRLDA